MNMEREQMQWCILYAILNSAVGVDSCVTISVQDIINTCSVTNATDSRTGIK